MSSRRSYRPFDERGGSKRSIFSGGGRGRLRWRDVRPVFLKSAGVVGLAGLIVAAISNESLFSRPDPQQRAVVLAAQDPIQVAPEVVPAPPVPVAAPMPTTAAFAPRRDAFVIETGMFTQRPIARDAAAPPAPQPPPKTAATIPARETRVAHAPAAAAAAPGLAKDSDAPIAAASQALRIEAAQPDTTGSLWPEHAVDCPRDWVPIDDAASGASQDCGQAAAPLAELAAVEIDQSALDEAALERASEIAALQFAPRIPLARPDPPPRPRKTASKGRRANWPAGKPPNCGKKRAKWRYVSNVPTWYCR